MTSTLTVLWASGLALVLLSDLIGAAFYVEEADISQFISWVEAQPCLVSPREFFREALRYGATSALAWHNHPSSDPSPSREDQALTKRLRMAGDSLGVPLADHIVVGDTWHSFRAAEGWD